MTEVIPCYFINLSSSSGRRILFQSRADELGIVANRVDACDGRKIGDADLKLYQSRVRSELWMGAGEIGCFLSHRKVWKKIIEASNLWAFVAEDDLLLADDCTPFFAGTDWVPSDADIVKADTSFRACHRSAKQESALQMRGIRRLLSNHGGTAGYFVSNSAAAMLLELTEQMCEPSDCLLFNPDWGAFEKLVVYQIEPAIGIDRIFLNSETQGIERSNLVGERKTRPTRPELAKRIRRELARPFRQIRQKIKNRQYSIRHGTLYSAVPFCKNAEKGPSYRSKRSISNLSG